MEQEVDIYIERKPDHYVGGDVSVTITANTRGLGLAEEIKALIKRHKSKDG